MNHHSPSVKEVIKKSNHEFILLLLISISGLIYCTLGTLELFPILQLIVKPLPIWLLIFYLWISFKSFYDENQQASTFPYHVVYNRVLMTFGLIASSLGDVLLNLHDLGGVIAPVLWIKQNVIEEFFFVTGLLCFLAAHVLYTISFSVEGRHSNEVSIVQATLEFFSHSKARSLILLMPVAGYMGLLYWAILNIGSLPQLMKFPVLCYTIVISLFAWRMLLRLHCPTLGSIENAMNKSVQVIKHNHYQIVRIVGALLFIAR